MQNIFPWRLESRLLLAVVASALITIGCGGSGDAGSAPAGEPAPATGPMVTAESASGDTSPRPASDPIRILFLGDSLSAGYGLAESQAFPALVQERLREQGYTVDVLNAGVSGDTTAGGAARLDWVMRSEPHVLVVELGGNDALRGQPLENTERNLREIVRRGRAAGAKVLLLGMDVPTNYGTEYASDFAALYERIAREEETGFVPGFIRDVGLDPSLMMADGLHPTAEGHRILAEKLVAALAESGLDHPGRD